MPPHRRAEERSDVRPAPPTRDTSNQPGSPHRSWAMRGPPQHWPDNGKTPVNRRNRPLYESVKNKFDQPDQPRDIVPMKTHVSLYDAKTRLSSLVDQAATGEEIVISKNGVPCAKLVPVAMRGQARTPANALRLTYIAADFDAVDPVITEMFDGAL